MRIILCILALFAGLAGARADGDRQKPLGDVPLMHEEAEAAGIHSVYDGPWEFFVGGGGAALDCDGSGFPSMFLAGGKNPARLFVNKSKAGGALKFEEKALDIGADPKLLTNVIGAYPLDIDGDGHMDLFVLRVGGSLLLKGGPTAHSPSPTTNGTSTAIQAGPLHLPPSGSRGRNFRRSRLAITSTATRRDRRGAHARTIRCTGRKPARDPTIPSARRWRRASARFRCCSPTGTSQARRRCASPTTGNITAAGKSRCGASSRAKRRGSIRAPTAGGICRSTAWA